MSLRSVLRGAPLALALALWGCGGGTPPADPCAPHGESHGDHCDCDTGYVEDGMRCVARADAGVPDAHTPPGTDAGPSPDAFEVGCGPHGTSHGDHCHCDAGYVEIDGLCVEPPPCTGPDDTLEENDTPETASALPTTEATLYSCVVDDDWFAVDLAAGQTLSVSVAFTHASSDIDTYLFAPGADPRHDEPLAAGDSTDDDEMLSFTATTAGRYQLLVYGYDSKEAPTRCLLRSRRPEPRANDPTDRPNRRRPWRPPRPSAFRRRPDRHAGASAPW
jgi:hypothetical protein